VNPTRIFDSEIPLSDDTLTAKEKTLLGFEPRYVRVRDRLRLLLHLDDLNKWNKKHHGGKLLLSDLVAEQYPLIIFHGDVGTGKTATAECMANRLVKESRTEDSMLFKLSNRVRGSGKVGEMGTLIVEAFQKITQTVGKSRRAILVIDEGDSLATSRSQDHSHHEDKVAVNTLIQCVDDVRRFGGRIVVFLCTNRLSVLDAAVQRRAAVVEEFKRPTAEERRALFAMDLAALSLSEAELSRLVDATGTQDGMPTWTYSDIRLRLYPAALAMAFPDGPLTLDHLQAAIGSMRPSPVVEDR
jgi:SpoVK/Ycf46/Vps4 family AAA+-type ATPase